MRIFVDCFLFELSPVLLLQILALVAVKDFQDFEGSDSESITYSGRQKKKKRKKSGLVGSIHDQIAPNQFLP
jgi:hypothetical protein